MPRRSKEDAEKTREQILHAALDVFTEKGYSMATFVDIAEKIGLTKGAVYWHFKTKTDLLVAMISYGEKEQCSMFNDRKPGSVEELRSVLMEHARRVVDEEKIWKFEFFCSFQIEWSTEMMAEVHEKLAELRGDPIKDFEQILLHLQDSGELSVEIEARQLALCMASAWVGSIHMAMYKEYSREKFIDVLMNSFDLIIGSQIVR